MYMEVPRRGTRAWSNSNKVKRTGPPQLMRPLKAHHQRDDVGLTLVAAWQTEAVLFARIHSTFKVERH